MRAGTRARDLLCGDVADVGPPVLDREPRRAASRHHVRGVIHAGPRRPGLLLVTPGRQPEAHPVYAGAAVTVDVDALSTAVSYVGGPRPHTAGTSS